MSSSSQLPVHLHAATMPVTSVVVSGCSGDSGSLVWIPQLKAATKRAALWMPLVEYPVESEHCSEVGRLLCYDKP